MDWQAVLDALMAAPDPPSNYALSPRRRVPHWYFEERPNQPKWRYGPNWPPYEHRLFSLSWKSWLGSDWVRLPDDWTPEDSRVIHTVSVPADMADTFREFCAVKGISFLDRG